MAGSLASLARQLARFAVVLFPFMPVKSAELWRQVGGPGDLAAQRFANLMAIDPTGWCVTKGEALFPKELRVES